jgi:hypothetical protein
MMMPKISTPKPRMTYVNTPRSMNTNRSQSVLAVFFVRKG